MITRDSERTVPLISISGKVAFKALLREPPKLNNSPLPYEIYEPHVFFERRLIITFFATICALVMLAQFSGWYGSNPIS